MKSKLLAVSIIMGFGVSCQNSDQLGMNGQNVELSYQLPDGSINGRMNFNVNGSQWSDQQIEISYDETEKTIQLIGTESSATFAAPAWWSPLFAIKATGTNLNILNNNPRSFSMRAGNALYGDDQYTMSALALNCGAPVLGQKPLENCLQSGSLTMSSFSMGSALIVKEVLSLFGANKADTTEVKNLSLTLNRGDFELEAKANLSLSVTVKGDGKIEYLAPNSGFDMRIRVDKLKASFLSIKDKLFDELKKSEGPNLKVAPPYIYISFDQE